MTLLRIRIRGGESGPVMELAGEMDYHTSPDITGRLPGLVLLPGQLLVVDLTDITFCDSSGITALLAARHHALDAGGEIALVGVPEQITRIFRIVGLKHVFRVHSSVKDAGAAWKQQGEDPDV